MEVFLLGAFLLQYENIEIYCKKMAPFLNIDQQPGHIYYQVIIILKTLYVMHAIKTTIPRNLSSASIIIGTWCIIYMKPIATLVALIGLSLHMFGFFMEEMIIMGIMSISYKSYEFLLDVYVLLCSLHYGTETYKNETEKLCSLLFMALAVGWRVGIIGSLPFSLSNYCIITMLYLFTIFPLMPKRPKYRNRPAFFYTVMYLWIFYKLGQHYDRSQSSAVQIVSRGDVCLISQLNFEAERCSLNATIEIQEDSSFVENLIRSNCSGYGTQNSLHILVKNQRKDMLIKCIYNVNQKKTTYEHKLDGYIICTNINTNANKEKRKNAQTEIQNETATPATEELIVTSKREHKESKFIETNVEQIKIFREGEKNDVLEQDYMGLQYESFHKDFMRMNENPKNDGYQPNKNFNLTESTEYTLSNNKHCNRTEIFLAKELYGNDVDPGMRIWTENAKKAKKNQQQQDNTNQQVQSAGTNQDDYSVSERSDNSSIDIKENVINYSNFITEASKKFKRKHNSCNKESENELFNSESSGAVDIKGIESEEFEPHEAEDIDAVEHREFSSSTEVTAFEMHLNDVFKSEVLSKFSENDHFTKIGDTISTKPILTDTVGKGGTKLRGILAGKSDQEKSKGFEADRGKFIDSWESEDFFSEAHNSDYPNNADDTGAATKFGCPKTSERKPVKDRYLEAIKHGTERDMKARDSRVAELNSTKVGRDKSFHTYAIEVREHKANEMRVLETNKGKIINLSKIKANLSKTVAADHQREARERAAEDFVVIEVSDARINKSQRTEVDKTKVRESKATQVGHLSPKRQMSVTSKQMSPKRVMLVTAKEMSPERLRLVILKPLRSRVQKLTRVKRIKLIRLEQRIPSAQKLTKSVRLNLNRHKIKGLERSKLKKLRKLMINDLR